MRTIIIAAVLVACVPTGGNTPETRRELCEALEQLTCERALELGCVTGTAEDCTPDGNGPKHGIPVWRCCETVPCGSSRAFSEQDAELCLTGAVNAYPECYLIDEGWIPPYCG